MSHLMELLLVVWFSLLIISLAYVVWHNLFHNPVSPVQKLAWILVTAYAGVFALLAYILTCRTKKGMSHTASTEKLWQQAVNSEMHCLAGDATGIILSAAVLFHFSLPNGLELIIEYLSAFVVGLFIFQALMMRGMYEGDYIKSVRKTFFAETVSMNMVMLGMLPVMVVLMALLKDAESPYSPNFWFAMGMATIAGGIAAYPVNYWLVKKGLKHGCMTVGEQMPSPMHHEMGRLSLGSQLFWILATAALLLIAAWITSRFVPIQFYFGF